MNGEHALAQLRHLYAQMLAGNVKDCVNAARGLLGPAIEALETERAHIAALEQERDEYREQMQLAEQRANLLDDDLRHCRDERDAAAADNAALVEHARTERQMLSMLYHRIKALGLRNEAMTDAVTTVERWMDTVPDTYEQPHPGAAMLEEHRKALVRAHDEGLEMAAEECDRAASGGATDEIRRTGMVLAREIREMKAIPGGRAKALVRARNEGRVQGIREALEVAKEEGHTSLRPCIADLLDDGLDE